MRIVGWSAGLDGCHHYRLLLPLSEAARNGHQVWLQQVLPNRAPWWPGVEVVVGQRVCNPRPTEAWQALARRPGRPMMVFEVDDDLFEVDSSSPVAHEFFAQPQIQANLRANIEVADLVTVSTPRLAEVVSRINPRVVVLENCVSRDVWLRGLERLRTWPERLGGWTPGSPMTVGWSGSPTHEMDLRFVSRALGRSLRRISAKVHVVGPDYRRLLGVAGSVYGARHTRWIPNLSAYYDTIGSFDVALAPLKPHPFNASKSWLRPLELAALGVPVIASRYGEYERFVTHDATGLLAGRDHEWGAALGRLQVSAGLRLELARAAHEHAADWLVEDRWQHWVAAYEKARTVGVA
jgi:glycosyltransferase involved in cell wall biosynthesis